MVQTRHLRIHGQVQDVGYREARIDAQPASGELDRPYAGFDWLPSA